jgi:hypothetical protein
MTPLSRISPVWVAAAVALALAAVGINPERPMVMDLDLPPRAAPD